jgi:Ca-activated chloride channel family protein
VLVLASFLVLILALARPQFGTRVETVKREGHDIFVALDVSTSMLAEDVSPNRIAKARLEVSSLIDRLQGDRIGLIAFAGEAFVQCPLTLDYAAAKLFLSVMDTDLIPTPGTAVAEAIEKAVDSFVEGEKKSKVLIIITDGEDHDGSVEEAARKAAEQGIVIYPIGIGLPQGTPIPVYDQFGRQQGFKKDKSGEVVLSRLNEATLRSLGEITGGEYSRVTNSAIELDRIYEELNDMDKKELANRQITIFDEKFQILLILAIVLMTVEVCLGDRRTVKQEWEGRFQ